MYTIWDKKISLSQVSKVTGPTKNDHARTIINSNSCKFLSRSKYFYGLGWPRECQLTLGNALISNATLRQMLPIALLLLTMNARVLGKGPQLLLANGGRSEIKQLLFAMYITSGWLIGELRRLVSELGRACVTRELRVYAGKNKVMRCSR